MESTFKLLSLPWLVIAILGIASSQVEKTDDVLATFHEELLLSKHLLGQLSLEVANYEQWFKNYQSQLLSPTETEQKAFEGS